MIHQTFCTFGLVWCKYIWTQFIVGLNKTKGGGKKDLSPATLHELGHLIFSCPWTGTYVIDLLVLRPSDWNLNYTTNVPWPPACVFADCGSQFITLHNTYIQSPIGLFLRRTVTHQSVALLSYYLHSPLQIQARIQSKKSPLANQNLITGIFAEYLHYV